MRYFGLMENDFANGENVCVSLWTQGCPHKCKGCHNPETWDFNGGVEVPDDIRGKIIKAISANNIIRNFSILGGEPLCNENLDFVLNIVQSVRISYPNIKIFIWSGYTYEELLEREDNRIIDILKCCNVLIDGCFELDKRDITLPLRGSSNQRIIQLDKKENF